MPRSSLPRRAACCAATLLAASAGAPGETRALREERFTLDAPAEVVATLTAGCAGCDWGRRGREAAALELTLDGRYSQQLLLTRGAEPAAYRVALGRLERGGHTLGVAFDGSQSAREIRDASVAAIEIAPAPAGSPEETLLAHAPVLHERPNTVGRFSDVPLVMWCEREATPSGERLRYSVVFSNEDGGTPSDRLMATWGRLTDIEYVYGVERDREGRVLGEEYQAKDHALLPFAGAHEAAHPVLYVATDNNMVAEKGEATPRFAPAPVAFALAGVSREAVMDAHPFTYQVSAREARREGRVDEKARPGYRKIPDPRRFATVEACAPAQDATLAFSVGVRSRRGELRWFDSDLGLKNFRIARRAHEFPTGCFRGAAALAADVAAADIVALRFRAFTRLPGKDEAPLPKGAGSARLKSVNTLFLLGPDDLPGPRLFSWQGDVPLEPEGPAYEIAIKPTPMQR
jgi:hypothetical protein